MKYKLSLLGVFALVWAWAAYRPLHPDDWLLENYLVFIWAPIIIVSARYFKLSNLSYTLIALFMCLHVIGSHYTYAEVPFGDTLQAWFGADRNMYDRMVHFSFGLLLSYPAREVFMRLGRARGIWAILFPINMVLGFSAIYEIIEWLAAARVSPELGLAFLGAQGDVWDAQKDTAMAGAGVVIAMAVVLMVRFALDKNAWKELRESFRIPANDAPLGEVWIERKLKK